MAKEDIRGGGFQGGVHIQTAQPQRSSLFELADALGTLNDQGGRTVVAAVQDRTNRINEETRLNDIKREEDGNAGGEKFIAQNIGLDSAALEAAMANPDVAEIMANPWAAAAVQKHRGRKRGTELATGMVEAGIDTSDQEAVAQYYADNAPDGEVNKFFASGLNEQNARFQAQWAQEGIAKDAREIGIEKASAWGYEANQMLSDGVAPADVMAEIRNFAGIKGSEATAIQMEILEARANQGDIEFVTEWANLPRDGAPPLAQDGNQSAAVTALIERAEARFKANGAEARAQTTINADAWMWKAPYAQLTRKNLEAQPGWDALEGDQQRQLYRQLESEIDSRNAAARDSSNAAQVRADKAAAQAAAVRMMQQGRGAEITDVIIVDQKGVTTTVSAESLRSLAVETTRNAVLGDQPFIQPPAMIGNYLQNMRANGVIDPAFQRYISAAADQFTVRGVTKGLEPALMRQAAIFANMDPQLAAEYVTDPKSRAVFTHIDKMAREFAGGDVAEEVVVNRAVAMANGSPPARLSNSTDFDKTLNGIRIELPGGKKVKPFMVDPELTRDIFYERYNEYYRTGFDHETAQERAASDLSTELVVVNGRPLRMPHRAGVKSLDPTQPMMTNEEFALVADYAVKAKAEELGVDPEDVFIRRYDDNIYQWATDGEIFSSTVGQMQSWASTYSTFATAQGVAAAEEAESAAVSKAVERRKKNSAQVEAAEKMLNDNVMGP